MTFTKGLVRISLQNLVTPPTLNASFSELSELISKFLDVMESPRHLLCNALKNVKIVRVDVKISAKEHFAVLFLRKCPKSTGIAVDFPYRLDV